jgi:hypothetical protein
MHAQLSPDRETPRVHSACSHPPSSTFTTATTGMQPHRQPHHTPHPRGGHPPPNSQHQQQHQPQHQPGTVAGGAMYFPSLNANAGDIVGGGGVRLARDASRQPSTSLGDTNGSNPLLSGASSGTGSYTSPTHPSVAPPEYYFPSQSSVQSPTSPADSTISAAHSLSGTTMDSGTSSGYYGSSSSFGDPTSAGHYGHQQQQQQQHQGIYQNHASTYPPPNQQQNYDINLGMGMITPSSSTGGAGAYVSPPASAGYQPQTQQYPAQSGGGGYYHHPQAPSNTPPISASRSQRNSFNFSAPVPNSTLHHQSSQQSLRSSQQPQAGSGELSPTHAQQSFQGGGSYTQQPILWGQGPQHSSPPPQSMGYTIPSHPSHAHSLPTLPNPPATTTATTASIARSVEPSSKKRKPNAAAYQPEEDEEDDEDGEEEDGVGAGAPVGTGPGGATRATLVKSYVPPLMLNISY